MKDKSTKKYGFHSEVIQMHLDYLVSPKKAVKSQAYVKNHFQN